jgi:hypothetical protein
MDDGPKFAGHSDSASPDGRAAGPDRDTTNPDRNTTGCDSDSVGTTCDTTDNSGHVSATPPEWIVAERDFSGKHAGIEFSGTSYAWHQHVAFDGEPEYDEQFWNYAPRVSVRHAPGKRAGNGGFDESCNVKPRL